MLFSAISVPGAVVALGPALHDPAHAHPCDSEEGDDGHTVKAVEQFVYRALMDKVEMLARMLQGAGPWLTIIFSAPSALPPRSRTSWSRWGFVAAPIHGDLGQGAREQALRAFRTRPSTSSSPPTWRRAASTSTTSRT